MKHISFKFLLLLFTVSAYPINSVKSPYFDSTKVNYLENEPSIDGVIDKEVLALPVRTFNVVESTNDSVKPLDARYRLAFGMDFLYVLIVVNSDSVVYRDRSYQNGDGFIITIAKPNQNNDSTDEFYVIGFSPPVAEKNIKQRSFIWYRNINLSFQPLKFSRVQVAKMKGKVFYQAIIYWNELYPFHPLISDGIGFNICFIKACRENDKTYYFDVPDDNIQSEQCKRLYEILKFNEPSSVNQVQAYSELSRNNFTPSEEINLNTVSLCPSDTVLQIHSEIRDANNSLYWSDNFNAPNKKGVNRNSQPIRCDKLKPDNYFLYWSIGDEPKGKLAFTLMPGFNYDVIESEIDNVKDNIYPGSFNTLRFMLDAVDSRYKQLKTYETCPEILKNLNEIISITGLAKQGVDALFNKDGLFRRGFLSSFDSTLRPYTIRVPEHLDRSKKYPLIVYLHGSGDDDRVAFNMNPLTDSGFIELYPNGRGTSNLYCSAESQFDIEESVQDVIKNYPVDTAKIILSGFSMGGYGVYRTFYENSHLYRALAIFSGHPSLPSVWLGEGYPDFLNEKYLQVFKGTKIFIFHGTQDRNCPFELTVRLVEELKKSGADVEFVTEATGHSSPSAESRKKFLEWLGRIIE
jgi:predicted esterase